MAKADNEDELKRQMRRRLVGAVALVTALVIILPMLLEDSPNPQSGVLELRIPDKEHAGGFTTQMVVNESAPEVSGAPEPDDVAESAPPAAEVTRPAKTEAAPKEAPKKTTSKPAPKHEAPKKPATRTAVKSGFAVQVGAYAHAEAANELKAKLAMKGWQAYTRKAGQNVRVRVGIYATRAEAESVQRKLKAQGQEAPVVVTEP